MATQDWPTLPAFGAAEFTFALETSESTYTGFFTGNRERTSHQADRMRCTVTLPPCRAEHAGAREAFLLGLKSTGDRVRFGVPHRPTPAGTLGGSPTLAVAALAGARSVVLAGAASRPNLLLAGTSLQTTPWLATGVTVLPDAHTDPLGTSTADRLTSNNTGGDYIYQPVLLELGQRYTVSAYVANFSAGATRILVRRLATQADVVLNWSGASATGVALAVGVSANYSAASSSYTRVWCTFDCTEADTWVRVYPDNASAGAHVAAWGLQVELGSAPSSFAGAARVAAGDFLALGGNLLQVAYPGASGNDAGSITVPLVSPLLAAAGAGAAVSWNAPVGLWELDDTGLQLDYTAPVVQAGLALPFRQVPA